MSKSRAVLAILALSYLGACVEHSGHGGYTTPVPVIEPIHEPIYVEPVSGKYR
jgi:hypothetical protein